MAREDTGTEPPIDLVDMGEYGWKQEHKGERTVYRLPKGIAELFRTSMCSGGR